MVAPLVSTLKKYGFSENEAAVYLCLIKYADISAFQIAKKTALPRTSVYHILESLENQRFISSWRKNNVAYFTAESPNHLIRILDEKKKLIEMILPDMLLLGTNNPANPTAKIYTGIEGMKIVWEDILTTLQQTKTKQLHAISHPKMFEYLPKYFPVWLKRREALKIHSFIIMSNSDENKIIDMKSNPFRETRMLPTNSPLRGTVDIYAHKIAFFSVKEDELYSIIIESPTIAEIMRQFFMSTWQLLGETRRYT